MPFVVGIGLIALGGLFAWGGISGRLAKMAAAVLPSSGAQTTSFTQPQTGFQQLSLTNGITFGGAGAASPSVGGSSSAPSSSAAPAPVLPDGSYLVPNLSIDPNTGLATGSIPDSQLFV